MRRRKKHLEECAYATATMDVIVVFLCTGRQGQTQASRFAATPRLYGGTPKTTVKRRVQKTFPEPDLPYP